MSNGVRTRGPWTFEQTKLHINELELLGAWFALQSFAPRAEDLFIRIFLDNNTAVCYINKCGGTKSRNLTNVAQTIIGWCERENIRLEAVYLPGQLNVVADEESRASSDSSDWRLDRNLFLKIAAIWNVSIDLFASAWNTQLPDFVSWRPQPGASSVDAFALSWRNLKGYAFPPFAVISKCIAKISREQATLILITPVWVGQPWFPDLLDLTCDFPRLLPITSRTLTSAQGLPHPLGHHLQLVAWKLSGIPTKPEEFRSQLSTSYWQDAGIPRARHTNQPGEIGIIGVFNGVGILYQTI